MNNDDKKDELSSFSEHKGSEGDDSIDSSYDQEKNSEQNASGKKYSVISDIKRQEFLTKVLENKLTIKKAADECGLKLSTSKAILQTYKKEGRIGKKKKRNRLSKYKKLMEIKKLHDEEVEKELQSNDKEKSSKNSEYSPVKRRHKEIEKKKKMKIKTNKIPSSLKTKAQPQSKDENSKPSSKKNQESQNKDQENFEETKQEWTRPNGEEDLNHTSNSENARASNRGFAFDLDPFKMFRNVPPASENTGGYTDTQHFFPRTHMGIATNGYRDPMYNMFIDPGYHRNERDMLEYSKSLMNSQSPAFLTPRGLIKLPINYIADQNHHLALINSELYSHQIPSSMSMPFHAEQLNYSGMQSKSQKNSLYYMHEGYHQPNEMGGYAVMMNPSLLHYQYQNNSQKE